MNAAKTILIVDDQRDFACMLADTLTEHDWQAHVAFDGREALQMVEEHQPSVVLLDIAMLHMSGYEVASKMRTRYGAGCPILIAHTEWTRDMVLTEAFRTRFEAFLDKPAPLDHLLSIINVLHEPHQL